MSLEDYTTATNVLDDNSRFTTTANKITVTRLQRGEVNEYVAWDKGAAFFDGDFTHQLKFTNTESTGGQVFPWCLSNVLNVVIPMTDDLALRWAGTNLVLWEEVSNTIYLDSSITLTLGTPYYLTIIRDESIGSFGQLQAFIYDDSARTSLVDTLTVALHSKVDWRYVYGVAGAGSSATVYVSGDVEDLDLGLAAAFNPSWARNSNQIIEVSQ